MNWRRLRIAMPAALVTIAAIVAVQIAALVLIGRVMADIDPDPAESEDAADGAAMQYLGLPFSLAAGVVLVGMLFVVVLAGLAAARLLGYLIALIPLRRNDE